MAAKWQRVRINIPEEYDSDARRAIAQDIIDRIVERTESGLDKNNRPFGKYSKEYVESLDFKIAGKSEGDVNLKLSGDMLGALDLLEESRGQIVIGYENGTEENAKADGNIRGTYGQPKTVGPKRDFLGITQSDLRSILSNYPIEDDDRTGLLTRIREVALDFDFFGEDE